MNTRRSLHKAKWPEGNLDYSSVFSADVEIMWQCMSISVRMILHFVYVVTERASGTGHEILDDTMSGDEDSVGERHYAQWKHVSHIRNHDTDWSENISNK